MVKVVPRLQAAGETVAAGPMAGDRLGACGQHLETERTRIGLLEHEEIQVCVGTGTQLRRGVEALGSRAGRGGRCLFKHRHAAVGVGREEAVELVREVLVERLLRPARPAGDVADRPEREPLFGDRDCHAVHEPLPLGRLDELARQTGGAARQRRDLGREDRRAGQHNALTPTRTVRPWRRRTRRTARLASASLTRCAGRRRAATTLPRTRTSNERARARSRAGIPTFGVHAGAGTGATYSNAPMSHAAPWGREMPRWSAFGQPSASPPSIAGLPGRSAIVGVGPPLPASAASSGSAFGRSPAAVRKQLPSLSRLWPSDAITWSLTWQSRVPAALVLPATIVLRSVTRPSAIFSETGA